MEVPWLVAHPKGWVLVVHVQPGAPATQVQGEHGGALKIRLAAPPVDGKANEALCRWLAQRLAAPRSAVELLSGHKDRRKRCLISNADIQADAEAIAARLLPPNAP